MGDKEYYISTKDDNGKFVVYESESFRLSEIDLINLIKICIIESRSKSIGRRLLGAYRDSTENRKTITEQRLNLIGIKENGNEKPKIAKKPKRK